MSRLLVIGCGGVAQVAIQKCCQNSKTFTELCIASRTVSKCDALKDKIEKSGSSVKITTKAVNADDVNGAWEEFVKQKKEEELEAIIKEEKLKPSETKWSMI